MSEKKYYTLSEAAQRVKIPLNTLRKHLPEIKRSKLGRRVIIAEDSLDAWVESKTSKPLSELKSAS
jgi:excisionase family DNA binding protein